MKRIIPISLKLKHNNESPKLQSSYRRKEYKYTQTIESDSTRSQSLRKKDFDLVKKNSLKMKESIHFETESSPKVLRTHSCNEKNENNYSSTTKSFQLIHTLKDQYIKNIVNGYNQSNKKYKYLKHNVKTVEIDISNSSRILSKTQLHKASLHFSLKNNTVNNYVGNKISKVLKKGIIETKDDITHMQSELNNVNQETNQIKETIKEEKKELNELKIKQKDTSDEVNKMIEEKKEMCTTILLIEKQRKDIQEKLDSLLKKQSLVNCQMIANIKMIS